MRVTVGDSAGRLSFDGRFPIANCAAPTNVNREEPTQGTLLRGSPTQSVCMGWRVEWWVGRFLWREDRFLSIPFHYYNDVKRIWAELKSTRGRCSEEHAKEVQWGGTVSMRSTCRGAVRRCSELRSKHGRCSEKVQWAWGARVEVQWGGTVSWGASMGGAVRRYSEHEEHV